MGTITVGQENSAPIELYYEDQGAGTPIVLVHGYPLSGASWEKQTDALREAGHRVITYDRRGFGRSSKPATGYDYDTFAADLHTLITTLDLRDLALAGFSTGGGEVARYLGTYGSKRVRRTIFISAIPPFLLQTEDNPDGVDIRFFQGIQEAIAADRFTFLSRFLADLYNVDIWGGTRISDQALQASWNIAVNISPVAARDCVDAWQTDFREDLALLDVPALVVHGSADRIAPFSASGLRIHKSVRDSQLLIVEDGPHGLLWTHPEIVNPSLLDFLI